MYGASPYLVVKEKNDNDIILSYFVTRNNNATWQSNVIYMYAFSPTSNAHWQWRGQFVYNELIGANLTLCGSLSLLFNSNNWGIVTCNYLYDIWGSCLLALPAAQCRFSFEKYKFRYLFKIFLGATKLLSKREQGLVIQKNKNITSTGLSK